MRTMKVKPEELLESLEGLNIIRIRFGCNHNWMLFPVIASNGEFIDIIAKRSPKKCPSDKKNNLVLKYQFNEYEYILTGKVIYSNEESRVFRIAILNVMKYHNRDYYQRFDVNLNSSLSTEEPTVYRGIVENISEGGAKILSTLNVELSTDLNLSVNLSESIREDNHFETGGKVLRKKILDNNFYEYGIKFTHMKSHHKELLSKKINEFKGKCGYVSSEYRVAPISEQEIPLPIAILSYCAEDSDYLDKALIKTGARNHYFVASYGALKTSIFEETPFLIIIDGISSNEERIFATLSKLMNNFQALNIIAIVPLEWERIKKRFGNKPSVENIEFSNHLSILYQPLVYGELEETIIKFL